MGCNSGNTGRCRIPLEQLPDNLFAQAVALRLARAVHGSEYVSVSDSGHRSPRILRDLHPRWHRDRPHAAMFPNEVHNAPPSITLLDVTYGERRHLGTSQTAAKEHRQDRTVA